MNKNPVFQFIIFIFLIGLMPTAHGQFSFDEVLEQENDAEESEFLNHLEALQSSPININTATIEEFQNLPWLSPPTAIKIIEYRNRNGIFSSIDDLKCCINQEIIETLRPYLTTEKTSKKIQGSYRIRLIDKLKSGDNFYQQSKIYNRLRLSYGKNIIVGGLIEKDHYEDDIHDFYSYYLEVTDIPYITKAIVGYYELNFGQGLLFAPYSGASKTSAVTRIPKTGLSLRPYTSANEVNGFRGIALQSRYNNNIRTSFFYSIEKIDATLTDDGEAIETLYETGYHTTESEQNKKNALSEKMLGGNISYTKNNLRIGGTYYFSYYDIPFDPPIERDRYYTFRGQKQHMYSISYQYLFEYLMTFGEIAQDMDAGKALIFGIVGDVDNLEWAMSYRRFDKDFYTMHGSAFGENSNDPQNEEGLYFGWQFHLDDNTQLISYIDLWRHPWRKYNENMPTQGHEIFFQLNRNLSKSLHLTLRHKEKIIEKSATKTSRIQLDLTPIAKTILRIRMEQRSNKGAGDSILGANELIYVGFGYHPFKSTEFYGQLTSYGNIISDSNIPVYVYERDLPGVMRNVALYDKGFKWYIVMRHKLGSSKISLKYEKNINDEEVKNQIRLQIDGKF